MGWADGIDNVNPDGDGIYVKEGIFKVRAIKADGGITRKKVPFFAVELDILESNNPARPAGGRMTFFVSIKPDTPALKNVRRFIGVATNADPKEVTEAVCEYVTSKAQPIAGKVFKLVATDEPTEAGGKFTACQWTLLENAPAAAAGAPAAPTQAAG